jgi:hypothetical protein
LKQGALKALPLVSGRSRTLSLQLVVVRPELAGPAVRATVECFQRHVPLHPQARS